eukprot:14786046-Alexandrium_andersonii.AAC.1
MLLRAAAGAGALLEQFCLSQMHRLPGRRQLWGTPARRRTAGALYLQPLRRGLHREEARPD